MARVVWRAAEWDHASHRPATVAQRILGCGLFAAGAVAGSLGAVARQPTDEMLARIGGLKHVANIVQIACALSKQCFASADVFFSERSAGEQGACGFCPVVGHGFCPLDFALGDLGVEA